jgi:TolB protein
VWVGRWNAALQNPLFNLVNLTNTAGDDTAPSWSPTATGRIAFASTRSGNSDIFTMTTTGGSVTQLTKDKAVDREPGWSPDGSKIAFSSNRATSGTPNGFEIYVMGAPTGQFQTRLTTLAGDDTAPVWLDASTLLFSSASFQGGGLATVPQTGGAIAKVANTLPGDSNPGT